MEGSKPNPFSVFDQLTEARAAMDTEEEIRVEAGVDTARIRRDAERRDKLGQLRAREHAGSRPHGARPAFGHVKIY